LANYLGRAGAYAMHKAHPRGQQTAAQIRAERENLIRARLARGQMRHTKSTPYHGLRKSTAKSRGTAAAERVYRMRDINNYRTRPLGSRVVRYNAKGRIKKPRILGVNKRFVARVAPGRYLGRTAWGSARTHKFKHRLTKRQHRFKQVKHWKHHGKRYTPR